MLYHRCQLLCVWFIVADFLCTTLAWLSAYYLRIESGWIPLYKDPPSFQLCLRVLPLVLALSMFAYRLSGLYAIHRLRRLREEAISVVKGTAFLTLLVMGALFLLHDPYESRAALLLFSGLVTGYLLVSRRLSWVGIRWLRSHGYNQTNCLIVGTGRIARQTARSLRRASWMGMRNLGFIAEKENHLADDLSILGNLAELPTLVEKYKVNHIFLALPLSKYDEVRRVYQMLSDTVVEVRLVADVPALSGLSLTTTDLDGLPVIGLRESPYFGLNRIVKRSMDIALSLVGIVLISPLLLLIALLIKLTSKGPILYRQERCGLNGESFQMLKFRSMKVEAEATSGAVWASTDDPRRTRLGTFLRKTSLDELPQFFNVLRGDMSLVGPRPERPVFIQKFRKTIPSYMARHAVKAGITGWAQVHGWRGNTSLRKRVQYDLYYITHWTPWLDLRILWMTIWHGFVHKNAY